MQFEVTNIKWDVDNEEELNYLPSAVIVDDSELNIADLEESISDYITNKYGFCHKGFDYQKYEPPKGKTIKGDYFILVAEWNYPTESGREPIDVTFDGDDLVNALALAHETVADEEDNFRKNTNLDVSNIDMFDDDSGYIITSKNGLDPYYYAIRIIGLNKVG